MVHMLKKTFINLLVAFIVISSGGVAQATIQAVSADAVSMWFAGSSKVLTMDDTTSIDVEDTLGAITTYEDGWFNLSTTLVTGGDHSSGGIASGSFAGGGFSYKDSSSVVLLSGSITSFNLVEVFNGSGMLAGEGQFTVTGGSLQADFALTGHIVNITFHVKPKTISDFTSDFTGMSDITVTPEPATIVLLGTASVWIFTRKKHQFLGGHRNK
jgi:hypothetical protein